MADPETLAKHTPGEWTAREGSTTGAEVVGRKPRGGEYIIARCGGKDREANADLIAAAPDLLSALQGLLERYLDMANSGDAGFWDPEAEGEVKAARAALARALQAQQKEAA